MPGRRITPGSLETSAKSVGQTDETTENVKVRSSGIDSTSTWTAAERQADGRTPRRATCATSARLNLSVSIQHTYPQSVPGPL